MSQAFDGENKNIALIISVNSFHVDMSLFLLKPVVWDDLGDFDESIKRTPPIINQIM